MPTTDDRDRSTLDCDDLPVREINRAIRAAVADGRRLESACSNPAARHNLGVALPEGVRPDDRGAGGLLRRPA